MRIFSLVWGIFIILPARYICSENSRLYGLHVTSNICLALHHPPVLRHLVQDGLLLVGEHNVCFECLNWYKFSSLSERRAAKAELFSGRSRGNWTDALRRPDAYVFELILEKRMNRFGFAQLSMNNLWERTLNNDALLKTYYWENISEDRSKSDIE